MLPELFRLAELRSAYPPMEAVTLEKMAAEEGKTVSAVLGWELLLVSANSSG